MRIRRKKWAKEELEKAEFYIDNPSEFKNSWNKKFKNNQPLYLELGCGKGTFMAKRKKKQNRIWKRKRSCWRASCVALDSCCTRG